MLLKLGKATALRAPKSHTGPILQTRIGRSNSTSSSSSSSMCTNKSTNASTDTTSSASTSVSHEENTAVEDDVAKSAETEIRHKTMAEQDEELRLKLEGISGEGGAAGLELEDGKPVAMKRGVKNNMFRLI